MMVKSRTFIATPPGATIKEQLLDKGMSQKNLRHTNGFITKTCE